MTAYNQSLNALWGEFRNAAKTAYDEEDAYFFCDICVARTQREIANKLRLPLSKVVTAWNNNIDEIWHDVVTENEMVSLFCCQETIGGWRQNPAFTGTYEECCRYLDTSTRSCDCWDIVPEEDVVVDYL